MNFLEVQIAKAGLANPWFYLVLFLGASVLMLWRLETMSRKGFEGTVLGTLVMPYCSGLGNIIFAILLAQEQNKGGDVMINCLVNNVTNLTLLLGLPAVVWGLSMGGQPGKGKKNKGKETASRINRLSLLLTLIAGLFFTAVTWALARDGRLDFSDGMVLVSIFLFWQCIHVFEVMKSNVRQNKRMSPLLFVDLALLGVGAYGLYASIDWLVRWLSGLKSGFISAEQMGWLSGWLMVLPNALLALYYGWRRRPEVIYSSQVGDGHICIPLCIGIFALFTPLMVPAFFTTAVFLLVISITLHVVFVSLFNGVPRLIGILLLIGYVFFVRRGLGG